MKDETIFKSPPKFIEGEQGERKVVLDEATFRRIIEELEDIYDSVLIDDVIEESTISADEVFNTEDKRRYGKV